MVPVSDVFCAIRGLCLDKESGGPGSTYFPLEGDGFGAFEQRFGVRLGARPFSTISTAVEHLHDHSCRRKASEGIEPPPLLGLFQQAGREGLR